MAMSALYSNLNKNIEHFKTRLGNNNNVMQKAELDLVELLHEEVQKG